MHCCYRTERRKDRRAKINLSVVYIVEGPDHVKEILRDREMEAETIDLSVRGVALRTNQYLPLETKITIQLLFIESSSSGYAAFYKRVKITGEVRNIDLMKSNKYRISIRFPQVAKHNKAKLEDIIYSPLCNMQ